MTIRVVVGRPGDLLAERHSTCANGGLREATKARVSHSHVQRRREQRIHGQLHGDADLLDEIGVAAGGLLAGRRGLRHVGMRAVSDVELDERHVDGHEIVWRKLAQTQRDDFHHPARQARARSNR